MNYSALLITVLAMTMGDNGQSPTSGPAATQPAVWEESELGRTLIVPMRNAPYPHASRAEGFTNKDRMIPYEGHYDDSSVAIFVPRAFTPVAEGVNLLFYFHGHGNNIRKALVDYRLREQIVASGQNLIMVFPEGPKDAADSGGGKLEEAGTLKRLTDETLQVLIERKVIPAAKLHRVLMAGHSGAYRIMSFSVEHGGLEKQFLDVCLLDSSYARLEAFTDWLKRCPEARLFSIFTDHLAPENVTMMTQLRRHDRKYLLIAEEDLTEDVLRKNDVVFTHTSRLTHNETVQWLERWLRTVRLSKSGS